MASYPFHHVDVFSAQTMYGNPLAVIHDAQSLSDEAMKAVSQWINLSMTAFIMKPNIEDADFQIRVFNMAGTELAFAGHATIGACAAWIRAGGQPQNTQRIVQQCGGNLFHIQTLAKDQWAFKAPPLSSCPIAEADQKLICKELSLNPKQIQASQMLDNGNRFFAFLLDSTQTLSQIEPHLARLLQSKINVGLIAPYMEKTDTNIQTADYEVRSFLHTYGLEEDPISGSLNAAIGQWLIESKLAPQRYIVSQGSAIGRDGKLSIWQDDEKNIWIGGQAIISTQGHLDYSA